MSDKHHIADETDLLMKSILENAEEAVPPQVWEGVSAGLDKIAKRKAVVLFWRRAAVGLAVAASIAAFFLIRPSSVQDNIFVKPDLTAVNVIEKEDVTESAIAMNKATEVNEEIHNQMTVIPEVVATSPESEATPSEAVIEETVGNEPAERVAEKKVETVEDDATAAESHADADENQTEVSCAVPAEGHTDIDGTDEREDSWKYAKERNNRNVSLTLSGASGASLSTGKPSFGALRRPTSAMLTPQTGVIETGTERTQYLPISFGVGVKFDLAKRWSLGVGINYTLLVQKIYGQYTKVENGLIVDSQNSDMRNTLHYIGIPVNVYFDILSNDKINFYAYAGGAVEKGIINRYDILSSKTIYKEGVKGLQWSTNIGVGVEFMVGKHVGIYIDPSARYYFKCKQPKTIRTTQPLNLGLEFGIRTRF